jgi:hypothetical protein
MCFLSDAWVQWAHDQIKKKNDLKVLKYVNPPSAMVSCYGMMRIKVDMSDTNDRTQTPSLSLSRLR